MDGSAIGSASYAKGGMGGLAEALAKAAKAAGAEIRTQRERVSDYSARTATSQRSCSKTARRSNRASLFQTLIRARLFCNLVDPVDLDPNFLLKMRNYRAPGAAAKINLALSGLPAFRGVNGSDPKTKLSGRIHIGPEIDYLERAFDASKYGEFSAEPYLDITIPSLGDPSLAPEGKHVMSIHVQFAPYKLRKGIGPRARRVCGYCD